MTRSLAVAVQCQLLASVKHNTSQLLIMHIRLQPYLPVLRYCTKGTCTLPHENETKDGPSKSVAISAWLSNQASQGNRTQKSWRACFTKQRIVNHPASQPFSASSRMRRFPGLWVRPGIRCMLPRRPVAACSELLVAVLGPNDSFVTAGRVLQPPHVAANCPVMQGAVRLFFSLQRCGLKGAVSLQAPSPQSSPRFAAPIALHQRQGLQRLIN